jgi:deoxyribose-phosphate aldolase
MTVTTSIDESTSKAMLEIETSGIPFAPRGAQLLVTRKRLIERPRDVAGFIEHTLLKPEATHQAISKLCGEANEYGFRGVCVNPLFVKEAKAQLSRTGCLVVAVVGFPLGASLTKTKAQEAHAVIECGADEVDMVIPVGLLKAGDSRQVFEDIRTVVEASELVPVKVILEMCLLDEYQKVMGCILAERAGAACVKTSTGFVKGGATVEDVSLIKRVVGDRLAVKAAGGIRDFQSARAMIEAGADRLGCSASVAIVS